MTVVDSAPPEQVAVSGFDLVVTRIRPAAEGVVLVSLRQPDGLALPSWSPGAHIDVVLEDGGCTRQYSLCGDPHDPQEWQVGVLREPQGRCSGYLHDDLGIGDVLRVAGPRNHFALEPAPSYLFIAGGIGITPLLPMIADAQARGVDWRLTYGGRTRTSMAFLQRLAAYGDKVQVRPQDEYGLLDLPAVLGTVEPGALVYCCGPEPLLAAVEAVCEGPRADSLRVERFAAKPVGEPVRTDSFEVVLQDSGLTLTVPSDQSILSVVEAAGIRVLTSCEAGTCGTCETGVLEGIPDHRDSVLTEAERRQNDCMLICVSRSCGPRLVLEL